MGLTMPQHRQASGQFKEEPTVSWPFFRRHHSPSITHPEKTQGRSQRVPTGSPAPLHVLSVHFCRTKVPSRGSDVRLTGQGPRL